jgi:hypothetical protein
MKDEALRPSFIKPTPPVKVEDVATITEDEKILATGSSNKFWQVLKGYLLDSITQLEQTNEQAMSALSMEEIGKNTVVLSLVKATLKGIINHVEDSKEAMENGGETK